MKSKCYSNAKSNERVQDALLDCKLGRGKVLSDRELVKLEGKRKKSGEQLRKSDLDYYAASLKAERARLEQKHNPIKTVKLKICYRLQKHFSTLF